MTAAAKAADLLAVRGDGDGWRHAGKARLLWPNAPTAGDWYVTAPGLSPIAGAFAGVDPDSLPPATAIERLPDQSAWVGAVARQARRGEAVPIIVGDTTQGRTVWIGAAGLYRWGFRGGTTEQVWRSLVAEIATWLLATPAAETASAKPVAIVTQQGLPVRFRWTGSGRPGPLPIRIDSVGTDTLRFDGNGDAALDLPVGRYRYALEGGGRGVFAVEPYSDEYVPAPMTLPAHDAALAAPASRRPLRELLWLFGVAIAGFAADWTIRRRMGMR